MKPDTITCTIEYTPEGRQFIDQLFRDVFGSGYMLSPAARVAVARVESYCDDLKAWKRGLLPSKPVAPR
jgi:hypothetical protein